MKKSYKTIITFILIALLGIGIYVVWRQIKKTSVGEIPKQTELPQGGIKNNTSTEIPNAGSGSEIISEQKTSIISLIKLSDAPVFDFWINKNTSDVFYLAQDGGVFVAKEGKDENISSQQIQALNSLEESSSGEKTLVAFGNPQSPQWGIFDSIDRVWRPLPSNIVTATWGSNENELVIIKKNTSSNSLGFLNLTKTPPEFKNIVSDFSFKNIRLSFFPLSDLFITELPSSDYLSRAWLLNTKTLSFNTIRSGENDLFLKWNNEKGVVFSFGKNSGFGIFNNPLISDPNPVPFSTIPQKCAGASTLVYCFVPQQNSPTLFEDYILNKNYSDDVLYTEDSGSGSLDRIVVSDLNSGNPIDAKNPRALGNRLFFINKYDGFLYMISGIKKPEEPRYFEPYD